MPRRRKDQELIETLKIMRLMDCDPYRRQNPDQPVVVMRLAHAGEIEPPMMLTLWDAKRLGSLIFTALARHGDGLAAEVLEVLQRQSKSGPDWMESGDPSVGKT